MGLLDAFNPIGALGSGLGSLVSGVGSLFGAGRPSLEKQLEVSKDMAKYEHDLSMDAWREQVAYNDPARQAERLEAAGFSKHNLVGNASINGNATGVPAASVDTPDVSKFQRGLNLEGLHQMLSSFNDMQLAHENLNKVRLENDNIRESTNLTKEDAILRRRQQELTYQQTLQAQRQMWRDDKFFDYDLSYKKSLIKQADQSIIESNKRLAKLDEEIDILKTQKQIEDIKLNDFWKQKIEPGSGFSDRILKEVYENIKSKIGNNKNSSTGKNQTVQDFQTLWNELTNGVSDLSWQDFGKLLSNVFPFGFQVLRQSVKGQFENASKGYVNWNMP